MKLTWIIVSQPPARMGVPVWISLVDPGTLALALSNTQVCIVMWRSTSVKVHHVLMGPLAQ